MAPRSLVRWLAPAAALLVAATITSPLRASAAGWAATDTQALPLASALSLGAVSPGTALRLVIGLEPRDATGLAQEADAVSTPGNARYGQFITPAEFLSDYAPTAAQVSAVESYLESQGFTAVTAESNRMYISADATAAQAQAAFHTTIDTFLQNGRDVYANISGAEVPQSLSGVVVSVLGLSDVVGMSNDLTISSTPPSTCTESVLCEYTPQGFQKAYNVGTTPTGAKTPIAIMAEGDVSGVITDLRDEETAFGLPKVPVTVEKVGVSSTDTSGADEFDLDTQYSTGMAGSVSRLYIYDTTTLTDSDVALEFNRFTAQDLAKAASASFGECEIMPYLDGFMVSNDMVMNEAAAQGQTVHASTGDNGSACPVLPTNGVPGSGPPDVAYPAASPYIVAVGGTSLLTTSTGTYDNELAWYAGGGGVSALEDAPLWQSGVSPVASAGEEVGVGRSLPDISMSADPNISGAEVYVDGAMEVVGGTSLSSPLALGVWARLESAHGNKLGFASPLLYSLYPTGSTVTTPLTAPSYPLHDIYLGGNGAYVATPGYDFTTGLGSYNVSLVNSKV